MPSVLGILPAGYDRYLVWLLAGAPLLPFSRSHPAASHHPAPCHPRPESPESQRSAAAKRQHPSSILQEIEKELLLLKLKEALARGLIPPVGPSLEALYLGAHAALRGQHPLAAAHHPAAASTATTFPPPWVGAHPLNKRQRFTFEKSEGDDLGRSSSSVEQAAQQVLLESLTRGGGGTRPSPHLPPLQYSPPSHV